MFLEEAIFIIIDKAVNKRPSQCLFFDLNWVTNYYSKAGLKQSMDLRVRC